MWQAEWVAGRLRAECPGAQLSIEVVKTTGDAVQDRPLDALGVTGSFTRELDRALLTDEVDIVVHSLKDMPVQLEPGLVLAAVPERADARDVFIGRDGLRMDALPQGACVGTGSLRRRAQLLAKHPDATTAVVRGNIDTRIRKLKESNTLSGIILAAAGVARLDLIDEVTQALAVEDWLPAPGQGALGVVVRADDVSSLQMASRLDDSAARTAVTAERALLARLEGGCHVPVGAYARVHSERAVLDALIAAPDGSELLREQLVFHPAEAADAGRTLAETLLARGGGGILAACEKRNQSP